MTNSEINKIEKELTSMLPYGFGLYTDFHPKLHALKISVYSGFSMVSRLVTIKELYASKMPTDILKDTLKKCIEDVYEQKSGVYAKAKKSVFHSASLGTVAGPKVKSLTELYALGCDLLPKTHKDKVKAPKSKDGNVYTSGFTYVDSPNMFFVSSKTAFDSYASLVKVDDKKTK